MSDEKKLLDKKQRKEEKRKEKLEDKARIKAEKKKDREELFKIDDPIGFMKIIDIIGAFLLVVGLFLGIRYIINRSFVSKYNKEVYSVRMEEFLQKVNIPEGYLPFYNAGNAYYKLGDFDNAISSYKSALESHPTKKKECDIRVNLALAMLQKIDFDHLETEKQKSNAVRQLQSARNVLTEKGCADPYGTNGHDPEAEQLKQDIDKMLEKLGAEPQPPDSSEEEDQQNGGSGEQEEKQKSYREQQLEKELNEQKQDAMEEKRNAEDQQRYNEGNKDPSGSGDQDGGNDYTGKNW